MAAQTRTSSSSLRTIPLSIHYDYPFIYLCVDIQVAPILWLLQIVMNTGTQILPASSFNPV